MIIKDQKSLEKSCIELISIESKFETIYNIHGFPKLRKAESGFSALLKTIVSQQLSVAAAANIWARVETNGFSTVEGIKSASDAALRDVGLSRQKIEYTKSLASSEINYSTLDRLNNQDIITQLTSVKGIGLWTAEIYLMFSMKRVDIFPAGDLALQISASHLMGIDKKFNEKMMREKSISWSPNRTAAALMLWDYYVSVKNRKGIFDENY